jgi:hypothetical protein
LIWRRVVSSLLLSALIVIPVANTALAACDLSDSWCRSRVTTPATVVINGVQIDASPGAFIEDGRVLVPLRAFAEALGATIEWDHRTRTVRAYQGQGANYTTVTIDSNVARHNFWSYRLDVAARIVEDRTFIPLRFMSEAMGASVQWDDHSKTATVTGNSHWKVDQDVLYGEVEKVLPYMSRCILPTADGVGKYQLCLDPDQYLLDMTPGVFREVLWHLQVINAIAKLPDFRHGMEYNSVDTPRLLRQVAQPIWYFVPDAPPVTRIRPAPSVIAMMLSLLSILSSDTSPPQKLISQAQLAQTRNEFKADSFRTCTLKAGDTVYGGRPGQGEWYMDRQTFEVANLDAVALWQSVQVPPRERHRGHRPEIMEYRVTRDVTVACGTARNNSVVKTENGSMYTGEGGGYQYHIPGFEYVLEVVGNPITLANWIVTAEAFSRLKR